MKCSNCGTENKEGYQFCMQCGTPLVESAAPPPVDAGQPGGGAHQPAPPAYPPPVTYGQPGSYPQQPVYPQGNYPPQAAYPQGPAPHPSLFKGMSSPGMTALNIWGPFAGFGTRRSHRGWVMDGQGERAPELTQEVAAMYRQRQIPGAIFHPETLTAGGVYVEQRPYFILRRGLVSLALNISQFGRDLFVSIAAYLKPPISNFRVILLIVMILFAGFTNIGLPTMLSNMLEDYVNGFGGFFGGAPEIPSPDTLLFLTCFIGPLGLINNIALLIFVIYSLYKWLRDKDILAGLRVPPNEFNEDDLMAMDKAVEQTVRVALDKIGLDPDELKPVLLDKERGRLI